MPLHGVFEALHDGQRYLDRLKHLPLLGADRLEAFEVLAGRQPDAVALDRAKPVQQLLRREIERRAMQTVAQRALDHQGEEADERVCTNPIVQAVDRRDVELVLHDSEAALDVG